MPTSNFDKIPATIKAVEVFRPTSILDIGIGFGKYGSLFRERLDIANGNYKKEDWKIRIEGVEGFSSYRSPLWECYNKIHIGNILELADGLGNYDVITILDVIEHLSKEEGIGLIDKLLRKSHGIVITTPISWYAQDDWGGNELERHKSAWNKKDFKKYHSLELIIGENSLMSIIVNSKSDLQKFLVPLYPITKRQPAINVAQRIKRKLTGSI